MIEYEFVQGAPSSFYVWAPSIEEARKKVVVAGLRVHGLYATGRCRTGLAAAPEEPAKRIPITVTVAGPPRSGVSAICEVISTALTEHGFKSVNTDWDADSLRTTGHRHARICAVRARVAVTVEPRNVFDPASLSPVWSGVSLGSRRHSSVSMSCFVNIRQQRDVWQDGWRGDGTRPDLPEHEEVIPVTGWDGPVHEAEDEE